MRSAISKSAISVIISVILSAFAGCGASGSTMSTAEKPADVTGTETDTVSDSALISDPKNEAGNGYVIIRNEADYPSCLKDFRYDCGGKVIDYWGNEVFSVTEDDLLFSCGVSAHRFENGLYGYIDINGETVIGPVFSEARPFVNGSALVTENGESYYIDLNGNKSEDKTHEGYHGDLTKHDFYSTFTGKYLIYQDGETYRDADGTEHARVKYGYSDADGNDTDMPGVSKLYSFKNGYALVEGDETAHGECYFINEDFERVTDFSDRHENRKLDKTIVNALDESNLLLGLDYILEGGYFVVNAGRPGEPEFELYKIVPELYHP